MRRLTSLPNQIRIVTRDIKDRDSVSIGVWLAAGGRYETQGNKGVAHFLEHMAFKGSAQYSCDEIKQTVEGVGGCLNAFTGEEETCYYAKVPGAHWKETFDVLADLSFFPRLAPKDLEKERAVILEEIKMYRDLPQYYVGELLEGLLWPGHPLGQSLAGTWASVGKMTVAHVRDFQRKLYVPANTVIAVCGSIRHEELVRCVAAKLGKLKAAAGPSYLPARRTQEHPGIHLHFKQTEQMHLAMGYLGYETNHKDYYVLALLNIILGGNMSSRLFNEVREKRGLAYSVSSGAKSLDDTGAFMIRAGVDNAKIVDALQLILKVLAGVASGGVEEGEFVRAREYYIGQFLLGMEDTMDQMLWTGSGVISNDQVKTMGDAIKKIKAVTKSDIQRVAREILDPCRLNLAIIGPMSDGQRKQIADLTGAVA
ncbi:MAG: insulinase family protein [Candidatus Omnitrophica bacterium]|nr:insulinase family protein [Candidatus Omnitrophota bacterium]MDE2214278.1 insulinase family protein [Candidatus Omnitrophota bacterium]MDE2231315.1 insulinase family protein [Candidatus Omnitrophota bacterium]